MDDDSNKLDDDSCGGNMYVVNHDAMYWRARAINAEAKLARAEAKIDELIDTGLRLAQTSSHNLLVSIMAGAFDDLRPPEEKV